MMQQTADGGRQTSQEFELCRELRLTDIEQEEARARKAAHQARVVGLCLMGASAVISLSATAIFIMWMVGA